MIFAWPRLVAAAEESGYGELPGKQKTYDKKGGGGGSMGDSDYKKKHQITVEEVTAASMPDPSLVVVATFPAVTLAAASSPHPPFITCLREELLHVH